MLSAALLQKNTSILPVELWSYMQLTWNQRFPMPALTGTQTMSFRETVNTYLTLLESIIYSCRIHRNTNLTFP